MKYKQFIVPALIAIAAIVYFAASRDYRASASSYYNTAVAQQQAGELGQAILNYERAAAIDPGASDIAANLAVAREEAASIAPETSGWAAFASSLSQNTWSMIAALSLLAIASLGFAQLPKKTRRPHGDRRIRCHSAQRVSLVADRKSFRRPFDRPRR